MSSRTVTLFVVITAFVCVVLASFDCRRRGQFCANGGTCPDNSANCTCPDGLSGYDCSVNDSLVEKGACNETVCQNGGTCMEIEDNVTKCACPPAFYGEKCSLNRYQVTCKSGSLLIGINPHGSFSGLIYVEDNRDTCLFDTLDSDKDNATKGWKGYAKDVQNEDANCTKINATFNPPMKKNDTDIPSNTTTSYTRVVYVVYEKTFLTSLDEVLTFTCSFNADSVVIRQQAQSTNIARNGMNKKVTTATLSPVKFEIKTPDPKKEVTLGDNVTMTFTIDSNSFDGARLESCVINDTMGKNQLTIVKDSCITKDAKSILKKPISKTDNNVTISIGMQIRVFKFVGSNKLGIVCKVKACPVGHGDKCEPRNCNNELGNQIGYGRRRRDAEEQTTEISRILVVGYSNEVGVEDAVENPTVKTETSQVQPCHMAKEVTAILAALGTVTLILLIATIVLLSRAVITRKGSKSKDERSETYSNLGQPRAFTRKC